MAKKVTNPNNYDVIRSAIVTEKSTIQGAFNKYSFKVAVDANKPLIKTAVEEIFNVDVTKVNVINYDGKVKRFKGRLGKQNAFKKAIVTVKEGQTIEVGGAA